MKTQYCSCKDSGQDTDSVQAGCSNRRSEKVGTGSGATVTGF